MPKLMSIEVKNFQALKHFNQGLSAGVNIIRGPSDVGKSSLVRALSSMLYQGEGTWFVRDGAKHAAVRVTTDDGHTVVWRKGGRKNEYEVDGKVLGKVGKTVPELVSDTLQVVPVRFGADTERRLNVQTQGERGFLVNDPGAECARIIGGLSGASVLGDAVRRCSADVTKCSREVSAIKDQLAGSEAELDGYAGLDEQVEVCDALAARLDAVAARRVRVEKMLQLREEAREASDARKAAHTRLSVTVEALDRLAGAEALAVRFGRYLAMASRAEEVGEITHDATMANSRAQAAAKRLSKLGALGILGARLNASQASLRAAEECQQIIGELAPLRAASRAATERVAGFAGVEALWIRAQALQGFRAVCLEWPTVAQQLVDAHSAEQAWVRRHEAATVAYVEFVQENPTCPTCGQTLPEVKA